MKFDIEFDELETLCEVSAMAKTMMEQAMKEADRAVSAAAVASRNVGHLGRTRNGYRSLATSFDDAESDLNRRPAQFTSDGVVCLRQRPRTHGRAGRMTGPRKKRITQKMKKNAP